jgi:hypothetical protein
MISSNVRRGLFVVAAAGFAVSISANAMAATRWQQNHPRRVEVNHRVNNLNSRIHEERKDGQISGSQAVALHSAAHQIRMEERGMASANGGHITAGEKHVLNQQENALSGQVGR